MISEWSFFSNASQPKTLAAEKDMLRSLGLESRAPVIDRFRPHPLLRSGHLQTIYGAMITGALPPYSATRHLIHLADGESMVAHEENGEGQSDEAPLAILVHGLGGDHRSPYMRRIASQLARHGVRVWRLDLRGCGAAWSMPIGPLMRDPARTWQLLYWPHSNNTHAQPWPLRLFP